MTDWYRHFIVAFVGAFGLVFMGIQDLHAQESRNQLCEACHYCQWDVQYAQMLGGGVSMRWVDPSEIKWEEACFFWHFCDCEAGDPTTTLAREQAITTLVSGSETDILHWVETNNMYFRIDLVDEVVVVSSPSCPRVYTWVAVENTGALEGIERALNSSLKYPLSGAAVTDGGE